MRIIVFFCSLTAFNVKALPPEGLPLYYWQEKWHGQSFVNFGDYLSLKLVERITNKPVRIYKKNPKIPEKKLLALGSILSFAEENDVIWGTGVNGKMLDIKCYKFIHVDVRAVRGPLTRKYIMEKLKIKCPEIYGDPALLFPFLFPEFKKSAHPSMDYIVIPHFSELDLFPKDTLGRIVYPTEPWDNVINKILDSQFVIASSLHGIIVAEAFGIPARLLRVTETEPIFKYADYYLGTGRPHYQFAESIKEALTMGGEIPPKCDLKKLYEAFPFEFWQGSHLNPEVFAK